jgi:CRISPR/Cas system-associated exonuclease Cas4 (RecB family)
MISTPRRTSASACAREQNNQITYRGGEGRDELIAQGVGLIEAYLKEPPPRQILTIEEEIIVPVRNSRGEFLENPLVAVADLITDDGELTVREFKTSAPAYSEAEAETSLQPTCYTYAVQQSVGQTPKVEYTVLIKTKTPRVQRLTTVRTDDDFGRLGDIIERVEQAVQAGIFYPIESPLNCSGCPFRQPCRDWGRPQVSEELVTLGLPNNRTT